MSEKNLLIVIIDTNPIWWNLQAMGLINAENKDSKSSGSSKPEGNKFDINDFISAIVAFLNAYKTMSQQNAVALITAHNTKADYLYPNRTKQIDKLSSPWDKYEQISDMDDQIKKNLRNLATEQLKNIRTLKETNNKDNLANDSMITSAIGLGLCYINRMQRKYTSGDATINYRILIVKSTEDSSNQYMNFMNMIFSAEKLNCSIDSCSLMQDSPLLQQASNLTNGFYFKVPRINGLLNYLLWIFLPEHNTRKMLVYPPKTHVDFRAACFCHRKLIDVGYVCSVCLSVFCSFTPICSTCNCNFQFDVNMLKKASLLKQVGGKSFTRNLSTNILNSQQQQVGGLNAVTTTASATAAAVASATSSTSQKKDDFISSRLVNKFQDTSLSSPLNPILISDNSNEPMQLIDPLASNSGGQSFQQRQNSSSFKTLIISANQKSTSRPASVSQNKDLNDSLEMLE